MELRSYEELDAWRAAHELTLDVYRASSGFPKEELFGLTSQLRRSMSSVPANLAEGFGRRSPRDFLRFVRISDGSLQEAKYFLLLAKELKYLDGELYHKLQESALRVGSLLGGLQKYLASSRAANRVAHG